MLRNGLFFRKWIIASTGLFLCLFLVVHLSANCILLLPESMARDVYNAYSATLRESPLIKLVAYALYASIVLHIVYALLITIRNRRARPVAYQMNRPGENSSWTSQNMGFLGILIFIFMAVHLANFWARIKLGIGASVGVDAAGNPDVYEVAYSLFQNIYYVLFYSVLAIPLSLHLNHGLKSAFKTLGFHHRKGLRVLGRAALIYALIMGAGFGVIPIIVYLK